MIVLTDDIKQDIATMVQNGVYDLTVRITVINGNVICDVTDTVLVRQPLAEEYNLQVLKDYQLAHQHAVIEFKS